MKLKPLQTAPQKYAPPVFYVLSNILFSDGRQDDAGFWFYAGQLRPRFDANRCADVSARQAVAALTEEFGTPINQYMFKDFAKVEALIPKVVEWDRKTPHEYDQRWINLHGMAAMLESLDPATGKPNSLSLPRDQWDAIAEKTRVDYVEGLRQAGVMLKERAAAAALRGQRARRAGLGAAPGRILEAGSLVDSRPAPESASRRKARGGRTQGVSGALSLGVDGHTRHDRDRESHRRGLEAHGAPQARGSRTPPRPSARPRS